jgi:hypothetical protein
MKAIKRFLLAGAALGAVGPILLLPVMAWLALYPHRVSPGVELVFMCAWPTSVMLMAASGARFFSPSYFALLLLSACSNVFLGGIVGLLVGFAYAGVRRALENIGEAARR